MPEKFSLYCEYTHCCGKQILRMGTAEDEPAARQWVQEQNRNKKRPRLLKDDLVKTCPVTHCPGKRQHPRYDYRPV
ncbi:MAG: hypothetical protein MI863_01845 [Desulfobacterales bacterium]|nr:hypothetical protein [Desulfobacterales bacterium]